MKPVAQALKNIGDPTTFEAQYSDSRWKERAAEIRRQTGFCRSCRRSDVPLHVHHVNYERGRALWDYEDCRLVALCQDCHDRIHTAINSFRALASQCNATNITAIVGALHLLVERQGALRTLIEIRSLID